MLTEYQLNELKISVLQCLLFHSTDVAPVHISRKATKRYLEQINAAAKLSFTFDQSIARLREKLKGEEKDNLKGIEAQIKAKMLRAMKQTGSEWLKQMMIKFLTKQLADEAYLHDSDRWVVSNDKGLPHDGQPTAGKLGHDPHIAAEEISQHACDQ